MGNKNAFLQQRDARDRKFYDAGMDTGLQLAHDYIAMALRSPDVMGKDIFGRARIEKLFKKCSEYDDYYHLCFTKHVEADKRRDEMDQIMKEIWGDETVEFSKRYPNAIRFSYDKPQKGWVE